MGLCHFLIGILEKCVTMKIEQNIMYTVFDQISHYFMYNYALSSDKIFNFFQKMGKFLLKFVNFLKFRRL